MKKVANSKQQIMLRRERRYFSEFARKSIVEEVERGLSKSEASRKYEVSQTAIYRWIRKYSKSYSPCLVKVVEHKSESNKHKELSAELNRVYAQLGRASAQIDFLNAIIDKAGEHFETDLKKNFAAPSSLIISKDKRKKG